MGILYTCKYCGREELGEGINFAGSFRDCMTYIQDKIDDFSNNCPCRASEEKEAGKIKFEFNVDHIGQVSDGSHTFDELYYHRMMLFAVVCNTYKAKAWKSLLHHDGTMYDNYFIVGIQTPEGQYSYHYHIDHWHVFDVKELSHAPEWDRHTPEDITRLMSLLGK